MKKKIEKLSLYEHFFLKIMLIVIISCIALILYFYAIHLWEFIPNEDVNSLDNEINIYGWIGIISFIFIIWTIKKFCGKVFYPYTIFIIFIYLFNYSQFMLWSLGIHYKGELGTTSFIRFMDQYTLLKIEMISIVSILAFHVGALFTMLKQPIITSPLNCLKKNSLDNYIIKWVCSGLLLISTPVVLYEAYMYLEVALKYGYTAIYYGNYAELNPLLKYISYCFFPSIIGFLIGNGFSKKSFQVIATIFMPYMVLNLLAGDRGSWIYYLLILLWIYFNYYPFKKNINYLKYLILGCIILVITAIFVKFREIGFNSITMEDILDIINDLPFVFIKPLFEMGQSARVLGIIIQDNLYEVWEYGNTYAASFFSMFLPRIKVMMGYPDFYLENWISQTHLGLKNYGVGFSIIAEAYLNGGLYFTPLIMLILGIIIGYIIKVDIKRCTKPIVLFLVLSSSGILLTIIRGSIELSLRRWGIGVLVPAIIIVVLRQLKKKNKNIRLIKKEVYKCKREY